MNIFQTNKLMYRSLIYYSARVLHIFCAFLTFVITMKHHDLTALLFRLTSYYKIYFCIFIIYISQNWLTVISGHKCVKEVQFKSLKSQF